MKGFKVVYYYKNLLFTVGDGNKAGGLACVVSVYTPLSARQWHHFVCTHAGNKSTDMKIYIDGVRRTPLTSIGHDMFTNGGDIDSIGQISYGSGFYSADSIGPMQLGYNRTGFPTVSDGKRDHLRGALHYQKAIEAFRQGGNKERKNFVEQLYFELKPKIRLETHRINFDEATIKKLKEVQNEFKQIAKNLLTESSDTIYSLLGSAAFFPKYANVLQNSKRQESSFLNYVTSVSFDMNKNVKTQTDIQNKEFYDSYSQVLMEKTMPIFHYILISGIKSGHLTAENFLRYLAEKTWIGKPVTKYDLGGDLVQSSWIKLLAPSIIEYFNQVLALNESKYFQPSFILCTDSLTLKLEGLMRSFCEQLNISTSHGNVKGVQEVLIHNILDNEDFKKHFSEDDILLFSFLFKNEHGLNLRNNIAHCFYNENNYSSDLILLLLASLLRLGKHNFRAINHRSVGS
jgi:hypothetical protein